MFRSFAVVPAAGRSERMGAPKLLLPLGNSTVIERVLGAWTASSVTRTVVVARADDAALMARCREFDVDLVTPLEPPPDMKASVQFALTHIGERYAPAPNDVWLLAPADLPRLSPAVIERVLSSYDPARPAAITPVHDGRRGHPTLLPWATVDSVRSLAPNEGVNALIARMPVSEIPCDDPGAFDDLDAPADYSRLAADWPARPRGDETAPE